MPQISRGKIPKLLIYTQRFDQCGLLQVGMRWFFLNRTFFNIWHTCVPTMSDIYRNESINGMHLPHSGYYNVGRDQHHHIEAGGEINISTSTCTSWVNHLENDLFNVLLFTWTHELNRQWELDPNLLGLQSFGWWWILPHYTLCRVENKWSYLVI